MKNNHSGIYRGRLAPSPTGHLHLGHAATFRTAFERARRAGGTLIFRIEDLDPARCREEFLESIIDDLHWLGIDWDEGPAEGPAAPYRQSHRQGFYLDALERLRRKGFAYPCRCSRKDVAAAAGAPQGPEDEFIYAGTCRPPTGTAIEKRTCTDAVSWRFRVPDGEIIRFQDARMGNQDFVAGRDFGDFVIWRKEDLPAYQLAVVVDDAAMSITEVVRGEDLLLSTARQILLYRALDIEPPAFYHCPLITDERGERLAKRHAALSIRALRENGRTPESLFPEISHSIGRKPSAKN